MTINELLILFNNEYYGQLQWVAISFPLGQTFVNVFLSFCQVILLSNCFLEFKPKTCRKYVNDTFLISKNVQQVEKLKQYLNSQHVSVKLTSEIEINNLVTDDGLYDQKAFYNMKSHF